EECYPLSIAHPRRTPGDARLHHRLAVGIERRQRRERRERRCCKDVGIFGFEVSSDFESCGTQSTSSTVTLRSYSRDHRRTEKGGSSFSKTKVSSLLRSHVLFR